MKKDIPWQASRRRIRRRLKEAEAEVSRNGDLLGLEAAHDLVDMGLDVRRRRAVKKKEEIQKEAPDFRRELFVLDPG